MIPHETDALASLAASSLFGGLDDDDRRTVLGLMRRVDFAAGQLIFSRGDAGNGVYLVLAGRVRLSVLTLDGRELSLAHATSGSVFGEIAGLDGGERTADATAISPVTALVLSPRAFREAIRTHTSIAEAAIRFLCARLRETDQKLEAVALHPIEVRLARLILSQIDMKSPGSVRGKVSLELGISQSEIGLLIGASRPKVNAAFALLEAEGAFKRDGQSLLCSVAALMRCAAREDDV